MVAQGSGVAIGATDGLTGWSLDAKPGNRIGVYKSENNTLQRVTLGFDPRTGFGQLVEKLAKSWYLIETSAFWKPKKSKVI